MADENRRRIAQTANGAGAPEEVVRVEKQMAALCRGIERLVDSYVEGGIEKSEFEPRVADFRRPNATERPR
jgi:site-specific DNA recombinase